MSLYTPNSKDNKKGGKQGKNAASGSKGNVKANKPASFSKKPVKTGGTRGS